MSDYVTEYFDRNAAAWLEEAYLDERLAASFPIGEERARLALEGVAPALAASGSLVDLGCGGGQLCRHAARLGWEVTGVDVAPAMIESARQVCADVSVRLLVGSFDGVELAGGTFDAVTALGLIEYLPADEPLLAEAARLLRTGGRFAVSCRNRLYSLASLNDYTAREIAAGDAGALLAELTDALAAATRDELHVLAAALAAAAGDLVEASDHDRAVPPPRLLDHPASFAVERRQHTPARLEQAASAFGFALVGVRAVHPHPLPPHLERLSPRFSNRLALAWQRPLEASPIGLVYCSAFVAVLEKRG